MRTVSTEELREAAREGERAIDCPVCDGHRFRVLLNPVDLENERKWLDNFYNARTDELKEKAEFTQENNTFIVSCTECDTVMRDPQPKPDELKRLYERDKYGYEVLDSLASNQYRFFKEKLRAYPDSLGSVLEIGSFVGGFLKAASEKGWQAIGFDIGKETSEYTRSQGLEVIHADVLECDFESNTFDAIFVWNTFDQLPQPKRVLDRIKELLKPGGLLVLRFPNGAFESLCVTRRARQPRIYFAQAYNNFITFPYLFGYNADSVARLLRACDLAVQAVTGDTILQLADSRTKPFAVREETICKRAVTRYCDRLLRDTGKFFHPWLDVRSALKK